MSTLESKKEFFVNKHSATVHISNKLSLVGRKANNILLRRAYKNISSQEEHTIQITEIMTALGWKESNAYPELENTLESLVGTTVQCNILGKDRKNTWSATSLISSVEIKDGKCKYAYSPVMRRLLSNPNVFARLNLQIQKDIKSVYSLILWEFLVDELSTSKTNIITTAWIELDKFRQLLGADKNTTYTQFKYLANQIIKPAIKEINKITDIDVEIEHKKEKRRVIAVRFNVQRKGQYLLPLDFPDKHPSTSKLENISLEDELTQDYNLPALYAKNAIKEFGVERIRQNLAAVADNLKSGSVKNKAAFITSAINNDYRLSSAGKDAIKETAAFQPFSQEELCSDLKLISSWKDVLKKLKEDCGEGVFRSWFSTLCLISFSKQEVLIAVPTDFMKKWIETNYKDNIFSAVKQMFPSAKTIKLVEKKKRI